MQIPKCKNKTGRWVVVVLIFGFSILPIISHAAQIIFEFPKENILTGDTFKVNVKLDTEGQNINAVDLNILYPPLFRVKNISKADSFISLWVKDPSFTKNTIFMSGGIPGGINSANALVGQIIFEADAVGQGGLSLSPDSAVLLNDGLGSSAKLSFKGAVITIEPRPKDTQPETVSSSLNPSQKPTPTGQQAGQTENDKSKPKGFEIFIGSDPRVFNGENFASFFTTDSQSGIDHYEIKEGSGPFKVAKSPYLLNDQKLKTVLRVRAYDAAGNYREAVYPNIFIRIWWTILKIFGR